MKKKRNPTLKNIVIFGKFSDNKVRQILCNGDQQVSVITTMRNTQSDGTIHVIDHVIEGIEWESEINIHEKIK